MEVTTLTVQESHRAVAHATVENHGETRGWGHPHLHHVACQPFRLARGHDVWYSKWEARVPSLAGLNQRNDRASPNEHSGLH